MTPIGPRHFRGSQLSRDTGALLAFGPRLRTTWPTAAPAWGAETRPVVQRTRLASPMRSRAPRGPASGPCERGRGAGSLGSEGSSRAEHGGLHTSRHAARFSGELPGGSLSYVSARAVGARWPIVADERALRRFRRRLGRGLQGLPRPRVRPWFAVRLAPGRVHAGPLSSDPAAMPFGDRAGGWSVASATFRERIAPVLAGRSRFVRACAPPRRIPP